MPRRKNPVPTVTRHAARNLVRVRLDGCDRYFGPWDIPQSHEKANRFIRAVQKRLHAMNRRKPAKSDGANRGECTAGQPAPDMSMSHVTIGITLGAQRLRRSLPSEPVNPCR